MFWLTLHITGLHCYFTHYNANGHAIIGSEVKHPGHDRSTKKSQVQVNSRGDHSWEATKSAQMTTSTSRQSAVAIIAAHIQDMAGRVNRQIQASTMQR